MDGVRLRVADRNLQHVVGKLGRRAGGRHLGEVLPRFRFDSAEHVGGAATLLFAIAPRHSSRPHGQGRTNLLGEHHRFLIHPNHRFPFTQRLFVHGQDVFHPPDVLLIQFRHAPHFFPATASGRGFPAKPESFPVPLAEPVCVLPLLRSASAPSSASGLPAVDHTPAPRCVDRRPVAAAPKLATPSAPAVNHSATSAATPAVPAWTIEPKIARSCPSYKLEHGAQQVYICITLYAVGVLVCDEQTPPPKQSLDGPPINHLSN